MTKIAAALAFAALLLGVTHARTAAADLPSREDAERQAQVVARMKESLAAEATAAGKFAVLRRLMSDEPNADIRRVILYATPQLPGPELDGFFTGVLGKDPDAGNRSQAATALGCLGSEKCLETLVRAAGSDPTTDVRAGCLRGRSSARRAATFALAELAARFPRLADEAKAKLRSLQPAADPRDGEQLADARLQALYQVTRDETLLQPFYQRLRSPEARVRIDGVVAFRFLKLGAAPPEVVAALKDADPEVRSWAALVVGEIGHPGK